LLGKEGEFGEVGAALGFGDLGAEVALAALPLGPQFSNAQCTGPSPITGDCQTGICFGQYSKPGSATVALSIPAEVYIWTVVEGFIRCTAAVLLQLIAAACVLAQGSEAPQMALREQRIELTNTVSLPGLPDTGMLGYTSTCSSDGDIYLGELVFDEKGGQLSPIPDLFKVSPTGGVKHIPMPIPKGFKDLDSSSFFAGRGILVAVIRASRPVDEQGAQAHPGTTYFLSVTDSDGGHPRLIRLDLSFGVDTAAAFESGGFVVLGMNRKTFRPVVAMLNDDGQFDKYLDVFPQTDDAAGKEADPTAEKARQHTVLYSIGAVQFAPWGSDILMAAPGIDNSSVYHIRASGEVERISIKLPNGEQLRRALGSGGKDDWVVLSRSAKSAKKMAETHLVVNPEEFLYEVNPRSGEVLRKLTVVGPNPGEATCAADGKLSAIYVAEPQPTGASERLALASAPR
jgi:hypothetical protein